MRVDFTWNAERVAIHVDSRAFHTSPAAFEHDARQRNRLAADWASFTVIRRTLEHLPDLQAGLAEVRRTPSSFTARGRSDAAFTVNVGPFCSTAGAQIDEP